MTTTGKAEAASAEQMAYRFCVVFTLRCQRRQVLVGANMQPPRHISKSTLTRTVSPATSNYGNSSHSSAGSPKTQHWFDDLLIH